MSLPNATTATKNGNNNYSYDNNNDDSYDNNDDSYDNKNDNNSNDNNNDDDNKNDDNNNDYNNDDNNDNDDNDDSYDNNNDDNNENDNNNTPLGIAVTNTSRRFQDLMKSKRPCQVFSDSLPKHPHCSGWSWTDYPGLFSFRLVESAGSKPI